MPWDLRREVQFASCNFSTVQSKKENTPKNHSTAAAVQSIAKQDSQNNSKAARVFTQFCPKQYKFCNRGLV